MILLLPGNARALIDSITPDPRMYGWLLTPSRTMTVTGLFDLPYAVDNERYTLGDRFDPRRFLRALWRIQNIHAGARCLFVCAPDVLYDAYATLQIAGPWLRVIRDLGMPAALVAQDGLESLAIPWDKFDALFIGGSTQWKLGNASAALMTEAKRRGKWVHMGRVNSTYRAMRLRWPLPDSVDGTAWAKHPSKYARQWERWLKNGKPRFVNPMF